MPSHPVIVVVTHNRLALLQETLQAWARQSLPPAGLVVVDNASTDGTGAWLAARSQVDGIPLVVISLATNVGGAGGFEAGLRRACETGHRWFCLTDDDALPQPGTLQALMAAAVDEGAIYTATAVASTGDAQRLCWRAYRHGGSRHGSWYERRDDMAPVEEIYTGSFLGLLVARALVARIGVPAGDYFLSADDVEYCMRARASGARVYQVRDAVLMHPLPRTYPVRTGFRTLACESLPAARRFYFVRNHIWNARLYRGPGGAELEVLRMLARLAASLRREPDRFAQFAAYARGIVAGYFRRPRIPVPTECRS